MSHALGAKLQLPEGSWIETAYQFAIGMVVGTCHVPKLIYRWLIRVVQPLLSSLGWKGWDGDATGDHSRDKRLKVVAVGYGRTGTYSLTLALEELGFPTLHTQHLYEHPEIFSMWTNQIFLPSIRSGKTLMGRPDLQLIANKFQATADFPMALYFDQVMEQYPECKFILTERESSETWFRSWDTLSKSITEATNLGGVVFSNVRQYSQYLRWLFSVVNKDESYLTVAFPLPRQNKQVAIESYEEHNARVRATIPPEQLLVYSVKQGWDPLCNFLEIADCPTTPFPKTNSARSVQVQAVSGLVINLMVFLFVVFYAFAKLFERCTGMTVVQYLNFKIRNIQLTLQKLSGEGQRQNQQRLRKKKA